MSREWFIRLMVGLSILIAGGLFALVVYAIAMGPS